MEEWRAVLEQEVCSIGYAGLDDHTGGVLRVMWDNRGNLHSSAWSKAFREMRDILALADQRNRERHPELNETPKEIRRPPDEAGWKEADAVVGEYLREALENASYQIRVPNCEVLREILDAGRFKTQIETGTSRGGATVLNRKIYSARAFGIDHTLEPEKYEVYGYASHGDLIRESSAGSRIGSGVGQYGQVVIKLKKDRMRDRTTMLIGSSLRDEKRARPNWVDKPDLQAVKNRQEAIVAAYKHHYRTQSGVDDPVDLERALAELNEDYAELQFHDGIQLEDIESVTLLASVPTVRGWTAAPEGDFPEGLVDQLKANGIQARIVRGGREHEL